MFSSLKKLTGSINNDTVIHVHEVLELPYLQQFYNLPDLLRQTQNPKEFLNARASRPLQIPPQRCSLVPRELEAW